jgi:hypothetical protein
MLITDIFGGATAGASTLTIPNTSIVSYSNGDNGQELAFGMLETMAQAVATGLLDNLKITTSSSLITNGTILQKKYTFTVNLDFDSEILATLDVSPE